MKTLPERIDKNIRRAAHSENADSWRLLWLLSVCGRAKRKEQSANGKVKSFLALWSSYRKSKI
jgi:hypothetical protein